MSDKTSPSQVDTARGIQAAARGILADTDVWAIHRGALDRIRAVATGAILPIPATPEALSVREREVVRARGGIAIVGLSGVLTPNGDFLSWLYFDADRFGLNGFKARLLDALSDDEVQSVVIDVDSPGGVTTMIPETAQLIRDLRGNGKKIVAIANAQAASAAYWLATQCDEFSVTPSGTVGSVGTLMTHEDWSKYDEDFGVDVTYITAASSPFKAEGNRHEPLSEAGQDEWQRTVDDIQTQFVAEVAAGRGVSTDVVVEQFGQGRIVRSAQALQRKMVDRVETIDQLLTRLAAAPAGRATRTATRAEDPAPVPVAETPAPGPEPEPAPTPDPVVDPDPAAGPKPGEDVTGTPDDDHHPDTAPVSADVARFRAQLAFRGR